MRTRLDQERCLLVGEISLVRLVEKVVVAKEKKRTADTTALEREIEKHVYVLYGLTPEEIKIVEGREVGAKRTASVAKPVKASATRKPRKSVMADDPGLA